jgi:hypothetical protein
LVLQDHPPVVRECVDERALVLGFFRDAEGAPNISPRRSRTAGELDRLRKGLVDGDR